MPYHFCFVLYRSLEAKENEIKNGKYNINVGYGLPVTSSNTVDQPYTIQVNISNKEPAVPYWEAKKTLTSPVLNVFADITSTQKPVIENRKVENDEKTKINFPLDRISPLLDISPMLEAQQNDNLFDNIPGFYDDLDILQDAFDDGLPSIFADNKVSDDMFNFPSITNDLDDIFKQEKDFKSFDAGFSSDDKPPPENDISGKDDWIQVKKEDYDYIYDLVKNMFSSDETTVKPDDLEMTPVMSTDMAIDTTTAKEIFEMTTLVNKDQESTQISTLQPTTIMKDDSYETTFDSVIVSTADHQEDSESTTVRPEIDTTTTENILATTVKESNNKNEVLDVRELESAEPVTEFTTQEENTEEDTTESVTTSKNRLVTDDYDSNNQDEKEMMTNITTDDFTTTAAILQEKETTPTMDDMKTVIMNEISTMLSMPEETTVDQRLKQGREEMMAPESIEMDQSSYDDIDNFIEDELDIKELILNSWTTKGEETTTKDMIEDILYDSFQTIPEEPPVIEDKDKMEKSETANMKTTISNIKDTTVEEMLSTYASLDVEDTTTNASDDNTNEIFTNHSIAPAVTIKIGDDIEIESKVDDTETTIAPIISDSLFTTMADVSNTADSVTVKIRDEMEIENMINDAEETTIAPIILDSSSPTLADVSNTSESYIDDLASVLNEILNITNYKESSMRPTMHISPKSIDIDLIMNNIDMTDKKVVISSATKNKEEIVVVATMEGNVQGKKLTEFDGFKYAKFPGIPYAEPPVKSLRFKRPRRKVPWKDVWEGKEGVKCMQKSFNGTIEGDEDCLVVNVWVPENASQTALPVMVWFHDGAYCYGSGDQQAQSFVELLKQNVIIVSMNYRLGAFGFFSLGNFQSSGNLGIRDQRLALNWVYRNIDNFGGDPGKVTLFGHGAGAESVQLHFISRGSRGLFSGIIQQSGTLLTKPDQANTTKDVIRSSSQLAAMLGCSTSVDIEECLESVDAEEIVDKSLPPAEDGVSHGNSTWYWKPILDKEFSADPILMKSPLESLIEGILSIIFQNLRVKKSIILIFYFL